MRSKASIDSLGSDVTETEALAEVQRLLDDARFSASPRRRRLIGHIVDEALAGRAANLKAYAIALDVFERGETFDPNRDPIVRIEMSRLRSMLAAYYADMDRKPGDVIIEIPPGAYYPVFSRVPGAAGCSGQPVKPADTATRTAVFGGLPVAADGEIGKLRANVFWLSILVGILAVGQVIMAVPLLGGHFMADAVSDKAMR